MSWSGPPDPATHYLWHNDLSAVRSAQHTQQDTPCGYHLEPFEVAEQSFTYDSMQVTCTGCCSWLARQTEKRLAR